MSVKQAMLAEARQEVALADHKASMVLAALGIGIGALLGGLLAGDWRPQVLSEVGQVFWWLGTSTAVAAVASASIAVWPRWNGSDTGGEVYFWGHIAELESLAAVREALSDDVVTADDRTVHQLWHLSRIVARKYRHVRGAFAFAWMAAALLTIAAVIG